MATPELLSYVRGQLMAGISKEAIRAALVTAGWQAKDIDESFGITTPPPPPPPPPATTIPPETPKQPSHSPSFVRPPIINAPHIRTIPEDPAASQENASFVSKSMASMTHESPLHTLRTVLIGILVFLFIGVAGASAYVFTQKPELLSSIPFLSRFVTAPMYTEDTLLTGILAAAGRIDTFSYKVTGSLGMGPREAGAMPFTIQASNLEAAREKYQNDASRFNDVQAVLSTLSASKSYPSSLASSTTLAKGKSPQTSFSDPLSGQPYGYKTTEGGKNFELIVSFQTDDAIQTIRKSYRFAATTTTINQQVVTFTKDSPTFIYFSPEPPKPLIVALGEYARFLPGEMSASVSVGATTRWEGSETADWKTNMAAVGDFGDMSFKIDIDVLRKNGIYYLRANNIPSLFLSSFGSVKGKWIHVDPSAATSTDPHSYSDFKYLAKDLPEVDKKYKEERARVANLLRKAAQFADEEKLLAFKNTPKTEEVGGRLLSRYDVRLNKAAIVPFYKKMLTEAGKEKEVRELGIFTDKGALEYLESNEFQQVFDYYDKNTTLTLWTDTDGFPAVIEYAMRIVPPDTAEQLKEKQANITLQLVLTDINKPLNIEVPEPSTSIQDLMKQIQSNVDYSLDNARSDGRDAKRISDIKQVQVALGLYYNKHKQYPATLSPLQTEGLTGLPKDTFNSYLYAGLGETSCTSYHLGSTLEATNAALSKDSDAVPQKTCSGSSADFNGKSGQCNSTVASSTDLCYDVSP